MFRYNILIVVWAEKEKQQYDKEINELEKQLEELKKHGPSEQQLALKKRLDEQREKKGTYLQMFKTNNFSLCIW